MLRGNDSIWVGTSRQPIPLSFVIQEATADLTPERVQALRGRFPLPELSRIDDAIANGTYTPPPGAPKPLALFSASGVDFSLVRLKHYTATSPQHFKRFVLFTNYQRYVDEFVAYGQDQVSNDGDYLAFVEPGNVVVVSGMSGELELVRRAGTLSAEISLGSLEAGVAAAFRRGELSAVVVELPKPREGS